LEYDIACTEFPGGSQPLEALNVAAIDFGTMGSAGCFARAGGTPLVYVGYEPSSLKGE
jgi:sulfonate transport system substrate-binding protein